MNKILDDLSEFDNVQVLHEIDATKLNEYSCFKDIKFDRVIFNFPCIPGEGTSQDAQLNEIETNKLLLKSFFRASEQLSIREIHITHKCKGAFMSWNIPSLSSESKFEFQHAHVFDKELYPGYENKKVNQKGSFPAFDAKTYIFQNKDVGEIESLEKTDSKVNLTVPQLMDI